MAQFKIPPKTSSVNFGNDKSVPVPDIQDWNMFQATIWDNWFPNGENVARRSVRYSFQLFVWTCAIEDVVLERPQYSGSTKLFLQDMWLPNIDALLASPQTRSVMVDGKRKRELIPNSSKISPAYHERLTQVHAEGSPATYYGLFAGGNSGYLENEFVRIERFDGQLPSFTEISVRGTAVRLEPEWWTERTPKGIFLDQSARRKGDTSAPIMASRLDLTGEFVSPKWDSRPCP